MNIDNLKDILYIVTEQEKNKIYSYTSNGIKKQENNVINGIYDVVSHILRVPLIIDSINKLIGKKIISNPLLNLKNFANKELSQRLEKNIETMTSYISFISMDDFNELKSYEDKISFVMNDIPKPSSILIKDDFEKENILYRDSFNYEIECYKNQINIINNVLTHLGATSIKATVHLEKSKDFNINGKMKPSYKDVKAEVQYEQNFENNISHKLNVSISNVGNYTKKSYEKAVDISNKYNLSHLDSIKYLLENRNPDNDMSTGATNFTISAVSKWNNIVDIGLNLDKSGFKIPINLEVKLNKNFSTVINYDIKF